MQQTTKELLLAALNHKDKFKDQKQLAKFLDTSDSFVSDILNDVKKGTRSYLKFKTKLDPILSDPYDEIDPEQMHKNLDIIIQSKNKDVVRAINYNLGEFAKSVEKDTSIINLQIKVQQLEERQAETDRILKNLLNQSGTAAKA